MATLAAGLLVSSACEKVPLLAPSQTTITLSAASTIVQANGSTEISATLLEQSGTPVQNGTTVTFSTTLGRIEPREARTFNGTATVRFVATGQSGEAEIRAASGGAKPADTANPSLKIKVGAAAAGRIQLTANPSRVPASGGSSQITAIVSDINGNALIGVPVTFSTTAGTLSSSSAATAAGGEARVTLTTTREATVTATTGITGTGAVTPATVTITLSVLPTLTLAVITTSPVEDQAVNFTLTVGPTSATTDAFQSVVVNFCDGTSQDLGAPAAGVTPLSHTYGSDGTYTVRVTGTAQTGDTTTASAIVIVERRPPIAITLSATPTTTAVGSNVTFAVGVTQPAVGSVRSVSLSFGDGSSINLGPVGTGPTNVTHAFGAPGTYTARATATDTFGSSTTVSTRVVIVPLVITITPTTAAINTTVTFTAASNFSANIVRYDWIFGDGGTATTTGNTVSHRYTSAGTPTLTVTVTTASGSTATGQTQVAVN